LAILNWSLVDVIKLGEIPLSAINKLEFLISH
jgi:hypothetical protein